MWTRPGAVRRRARRPTARPRAQARALPAPASRDRLGRRSRATSFRPTRTRWYYLWRERRLPINVDPLDSRLADPLERERLRARVRAQGLDKLVGHALPIARDPSGRAGAGGPAVVPARRALLPDPRRLADGLPPAARLAAVGRRRPTCPWIHPPDPNQAFAPLPPHRRRRLQRRRDEAARAARPSGADSPDGGTALACADDGSARLATTASTLAHATVRASRAAFESAVRRAHRARAPSRATAGSTSSCRRSTALEDYLELVARGRGRRRATMRLPVDARRLRAAARIRASTVLRVTPDPGVIEVNIHPAHSWAELVEQTTHLYEAAHETRLSTEKFMLDGRHTGTGGGNHFVLGGATPADSPFLRRPDLLASMVAYWHNHPALSYLFSGLFVGPTSQAPRIDEARNDSVYEIEIAFAELAARRRGRSRRGAAVAGRPAAAQPAGRRHRQHAPRRVLHRQALLARRPDRPARPARDARLRDAAACAHEPGAAAADARAGRALLEPSRTGRRGSRAGAPSCTTASCCRTSSGRTSRDVIDELRDVRLPDASRSGSRRTSSSAFRSSATSRPPASRSSCAWRSSPGTCSARRAAPAAPRATSTRRSSGCRSRSPAWSATATCSPATAGALPLQPTGTVGEFVAGVRYRAWHAAVGAAPDDRRARAAHLRPGRHLDGPLARRLPVPRRASGRPQLRRPSRSTRYEAEARRLARFFRTGHTPGAMTVPAGSAQPGLPVHARPAPLRHEPRRSAGYRWTDG